MTNTERARYAANFMKRRTSRIVSAQNGCSDVMSQMQFDADPSYNSGTLEETNDSSIGAPSDTTQGSDNDSNWAGSVPGGSNDDTAITGALDILQKHIEAIGSSDLLAAWASTSDALKRTVSSGMGQAKPNADGQTREPLVVNDNQASSTPGSHGYISVADLENSARELTTLSSRIVNVDRL